MPLATKVGPEYQGVIPKTVRQAAGLKPGDLIEATFVRDAIVLKPKVLVDRDLEDALTEALADVRAARVSKPSRSVRVLVRDALEAGKPKQSLTRAKK